MIDSFHLLELGDFVSKAAADQQKVGSLDGALIAYRNFMQTYLMVGTYHSSLARFALCEQ